MSVCLAAFSRVGSNSDENNQSIANNSEVALEETKIKFLLLPSGIMINDQNNKNIQRHIFGIQEA